MPFPIESAPQIFGRDFIREEAVRGMFVPHSSNAPKTDLSPQELILAQSKGRGEFLFHRVDKASDGSPLTMHRMSQLLQERFDQAKAGKILFDTTWYQDEAFFMEETPRAGLVVVSKAPIPGSVNKTYHGQTQTLIDYVVNQVFKDRALSKTANESVRQWEKEKKGLAKLQDSNWIEAAKELSQLVINQSFRERAVEVKQSVVVPFLENGERRLENQFTWTNSRTSDGGLVSLGRFDPRGLDVGGWDPGFGRPCIGVCFSAAVEDLVS